MRCVILELLYTTENVMCFAAIVSYKGFLNFIRIFQMPDADYVFIEHRHDSTLAGRGRRRPNRVVWIRICS
jgi:hypothetical protein